MSITNAIVLRCSMIYKYNEIDPCRSAAKEVSRWLRRLSQTKEV